MEWREAFLSFSVRGNKIGGLHFTLCASESILLQHVAGEALTPERARRVDAFVVADVALIYQALIHVLHLNRTLHCILPILCLADGEGLFRVQAVWFYNTGKIIVAVPFVHTGKKKNTRENTF